jgi:hypothetical protein
MWPELQVSRRESIDETRAYQQDTNKQAMSTADVFNAAIVHDGPLFPSD